MGETVYIDSKGADGAVGFIFEGEPCQVVWTGAEAQVERRDKNTAPLLDGLARLAGVEMLEEAVLLPFYAVPILRVFARDGRGGWFASTEEYERDSPVCHLAPDLSPRVVAPSFTAFLLRALTDPAWRSDLLPGGPWSSLPEDPAGRAEIIAALKLELEETKVLPPPPRVFPSRRDAEAVFPIRDMWELVPAARFKIRKMSPAHQDGKGYVHYQSWQETYRGLMDDRILDSLSLDRCRELAKRYPESTLVALDQANGDKVVGFACYAKEAREFITLPGASELCALYVLKEYQGRSLGERLLDECLFRLPHPQVGLLVLEGNRQAIGFYEHMGFRLTGRRRTDQLYGAEITELEMVLDRDETSRN